MNRMKQNILVIISFVFVIVTILWNIEQDNELEKLSKKNKMLQAQLTDTDIKYAKNSFKYLAIGNSITKHGICDYWWHEGGMAATNSEQDYFHFVLANLKEQKKKVSSYAVNFSIWETQSADRAETIEVLQPYLDKNLDLVTVQLGENAVDLNTFQNDYVYLINYIKNIAPNASIILVGDFWNYENREMIKKEVATLCNVKYANLDEIRDNAAYQCGLGNVVYDTLGNQHIVEHEGVAKHPNDQGMLYIANAIIALLDS